MLPTLLFALTSMPSLAFTTYELSGPYSDLFYEPGRAEIVEAGGWHACALTDCGTIVCGGWNFWGVADAPSDDDFVDVAAGTYHSCGLHADGRAECWGDGSWGQLQVPEGVSFTQISAGHLHTCGVTSDETVTCWGWNGYGQLTPNGAITRAVRVEAGSYHTCAVGYDALGARTQTCWGRSVEGQLNAPDANHYRLVGGFGRPQQHLIWPTAGDRHSCGISNSDRSLFCWGDDAYGQVTGVGYDPRYPTSPYALADETGLAVFLDARFQHVSAGTFHTCAVTTMGEVRCFGNDSYGESTPPAGVTFEKVSAGYNFTCGITTGGEVDCWGDGTWGQTVAPDLSKACSTLTAGW